MLSIAPYKQPTSPRSFIGHLDALLMEMKNARTIAEHLKAEHADPACRVAAVSSS